MAGIRDEPAGHCSAPAKDNTPGSGRTRAVDAQQQRFSTNRHRAGGHSNGIAAAPRIMQRFPYNLHWPALNFPSMSPPLSRNRRSLIPQASPIRAPTSNARSRMSFSVFGKVFHSRRITTWGSCCGRKPHLIPGTGSAQPTPNPARYAFSVPWSTRVNSHGPVRPKRPTDSAWIEAPIHTSPTVSTSLKHRVPPPRNPHRSQPISTPPFRCTARYVVHFSGRPVYLTAASTVGSVFVH